MQTDDYAVGDKVNTPYGPGEVVAVNPGYGVEVRYARSGREDWHRFEYVRALRSDEVQPAREIREEL
jgi:hypothetical protein